MPPIFDVTFAAGAPLDLTRDLLYGAAVTSTLAAALAATLGALACAVPSRPPPDLAGYPAVPRTHRCQPLSAAAAATGAAVLAASLSAAAARAAATDQTIRRRRRRRRLQTALAVGHRPWRRPSAPLSFISSSVFLFAALPAADRALTRRFLEGYTRLGVRPSHMRVMVDATRDPARGAPTAALLRELGVAAAVDPRGTTAAARRNRSSAFFRSLPGDAWATIVTPRGGAAANLTRAGREPFRLECMREPLPGLAADRLVLYRAREMSRGRIRQLDDASSSTSELGVAPRVPIGRRRPPEWCEALCVRAAPVG